MQLINDITTRNSKTNNLNKLLNSINNNTEPNDGELAYILADKFHNYFINVASNLVTQLINHKNIDNSSTFCPSNNTIILNNTSLNKFEFITYSRILEATSKLKNGPSPGIGKHRRNVG